MEKEIPSKLVGRPQPKLPWLDAKLKDLIKQKHAAWSACKRFPSSAANLCAFRSIRNKVTSALRAAEKQYLQSLHRDMRLVNRCDSVKSFWAYIKRVTGKVKTSAILDLEILQGSTPMTVTLDAEKASILSEHFARQTHLADCPEALPVLPPPSQLSPDAFSSTPTEVFDVLSGLKLAKAPGLDDLPPKLLSLRARGISVSLCALFNRSFTEGRVPSDWKEAFVVPVHKNGSKNSPSNYRPIALLSIVSKAMEKNCVEAPYCLPRSFAFFETVRITAQRWHFTAAASPSAGVVRCA